VPYEACAGHTRRADVVEAGELVQFSSGSTGRPRGVAVAVAKAGDLDRAETIARSVTGRSSLPTNAGTYRDFQAEALARLALEVPPPRARRLTAHALGRGGWQACLAALARVEPAAIAATADEYLNIMSLGAAS
jgi:hypothetical protein